MQKISLDYYITKEVAKQEMQAFFGENSATVANTLPASLELVGKETLKRGTVLGETSDTLSKLGVGHGVSGKGKEEGRLVVNERNLLLSLDVVGGKLPLDRAGGVLHLLKQLGADGQVVAAGKLERLSGRTEAGTHDDSLVAVSLVVRVDPLDREDTRVLVGLIGVALGLVEVKNSANEGRDKGDVGLSASNSLGKTEEERQVAVDVVVTLELAGSLDTLPSGGNLDQDALPLDANRLVKCDKVLGLGNSSLLVERKTGVNLGRDTARDDLEDLRAELDEETVSSVGDLLLLVTALLLGVLDGNVNQTGVLLLLDGSEDKRLRKASRKRARQQSRVARIANG